MYSESLMLWVSVINTWLLDTDAGSSADAVNCTCCSDLAVHRVRFTFYILLNREIDPPPLKSCLGFSGLCSFLAIYSISSCSPWLVFSTHTAVTCLEVGLIASRTHPAIVLCALSSLFVPLIPAR